MDGWITFGTRLETKELEKQLKDQERQLKQYEKEAEKLTTTKSKIEMDFKPLKEAVEYEQQLKKELDDLISKQKELNEQWEQGDDATKRSVIGQLHEVSAMRSEVFGKYVDIGGKPDIEAYRQTKNELDEIERKLKENKANQELITQEVEKTNQKLKQSEGAEEFKKKVKEIGDESGKVVNKIAKWGLAIVGVRSAIGFIKSATSTLSQYDDKMAKNIEYIRYALAVMIKPLIEWIINALMKAMTYINYIVKSWFNINLFENAGIDNFNKDLNKANKNAKELKKTLTSIDEANILSDALSSSTSSSATPSLDFSVTQIQVPEWVQWIADHKELILGLASAVGIAFATGKTTEIVSNIAKILGVAGTGLTGATGLIGLASILGIIAGLATIVITITYFLQNRDQLLQDLEHIREINQKRNQAWYENVEASQDVNQYTEKIEGHLDSARDSLEKSSEFWYIITGTSQSLRDDARSVAENTDAIVEGAKKMWEWDERSLDDKVKIRDTLDHQYNTNLKIIETLQKEGESTLGLEQSNDRLKKQLDLYNQELENTPEYVENANYWWKKVGDELKIIDDYEIGDKEFIVKAKTDGAKKNLLELLKTAFFGKKVIESETETKNANVLTAGGLTGLWNSFKGKLGLYTGGIVNLPNRGVPVGASAIAGERGREGVIPLTDPNAMAQLGKEIGQWVNLAIDNRMVVDGRVLATATNNQTTKERFLRNR